MSYVFGVTHKFRDDGEIVPMTRAEKDKAKDTCERIGEQACNALIAAAVAAAMAVIGTLAVDLGRQGGGTRKAKKSKRKARATRSRKH
jgi:hypothetical protein